MRLLETNTRFFNEKSFGVPQVRNVWGSLVEVLDSCLVYGTPEQPILSITTVEDPEYPELYWTSTLLLNEGHSFEKEYSVIEIKGSEDPVYNSVHRVQKVSSTKIEIAFSKSTQTEKPRDSLPTETLTVKLAPLGYQKVFEEPNKAVYRSSDLDSTAHFLRVDNSCPLGYDPTWAKFARVSIYSDLKSMDDYSIRPGRLKAPYYPEDPHRAEEQSGSGNSGTYGESKWYHSTKAVTYPTEAETPSSSGPFSFDIIGDNKTFYLTLNLRGYTEYWQRVGYCFGEYNVLSNKFSNSFNTMLCSHENSTPANSTSFGYTANPGRTEEGSAFGRANNSSGKYFFDSSYEGSILGKHVKGSFFSLVIGSYSGFDTGFSYNQYTTEINFLEVYIRLFYPRATILGGKMRGYYFVGNNISSDNFHLNPSTKDIFDSETEHGLKMKLGLFDIFHSKSSSSDSIGNLKVAFKLNNWE